MKSGLEQDRLLQETLRFGRARELWTEGDRILVAVSGGLDSTVLAHVLSRLKNMAGFELDLVHVDHGTRGLASRSEATWVRVLAERLGLESHALSLADMPSSSQADLRRLRRAALLALAAECAATRIATAHHADDNAETFLMRAISGTGARGLAGIAPKDQLWIRPLLSATREDLENYAREQRLGWVEDPSNARDAYLRNKLRHGALPLLEESRGGAIRNLARAAERLADEERAWDDWVQMQLEGPAEILSLAWLERWPSPLKRRIFKGWLTRLGLDPQPALIEGLIRGEDLVHAKGSFLRRSDMLVFTAEEDFGSLWTGLIAIKLGTRLPLGSSMAWSFLPGAPVKARAYDLALYLNFRQPGTARVRELQMDWERIPWPLALRARSADDPKSFDDILRKHEIPRPYWKTWPLLVAAESPELVVGLVGIEVFAAYRLQDLGRCVSVECFFEERLSAASPA